MSSPELPSAPLDPVTMRAGLLLEAVEAQRREAGELLADLQGQLQGFRAVLHEEIRAVLGQSAPGWGARLQRALPGALVAALTGAASVAVAVLTVPSPARLEALRARSAELTATVTVLEREGGRAQLKRCGASARLCIRIEPGAPAYGTGGEFRVIKGY